MFGVLSPDLMLCRRWKCLLFTRVLRGGYFFVGNSGFQCGKIVSCLTFYSAPGRTVCVWDSVSKICIPFCDLQVLGSTKEYLNKLLWVLLHVFLHGKLIL